VSNYNQLKSAWSILKSRLFRSGLEYIKDTLTIIGRNANMQDSDRGGLFDEIKSFQNHINIHLKLIDLSWLYETPIGKQF
jgi:hypothetical protein